MFLMSVSLFDRKLFLAFLFIAFLAAVAFYFIRKRNDKKFLGTLFLIAFLIHLSAVFFIYYFKFEPFGGAGDYIEYNIVAQKTAERIQRGNFSLDGIEISHYYPIIIGYIYAFTLPDMLFGQIFNAFLAALLAVLIYLTIIEMGGSENQGFVAGLSANFYPSLLFFGSLLLKDIVVIFLSFIVLLMTLKLIKGFSKGKFLLFYLALGVLMHFRIYVGYAGLLAFIICWPLFSDLAVKKRLKYLFIIIPLLGFLPQVFAGQGWYGIGFLSRYLNKGTITYYREMIYAPQNQVQKIQQSVIKQANEPKVQKTEPLIIKQANEPEVQKTEPLIIKQANEPEAPKISSRGRGSSIMIKTGLENPFTFLRNTSLSFTYAFLGPFPWQVKPPKRYFALFETIPWYVLLFFAVKGVISHFKGHYRFFLPLLVFSFFVFGTLAVFITNFGIITRIRMPAALAILCLFPFGLKGLNIKIPFLKKI